MSNFNKISFVSIGAIILLVLLFAVFPGKVILQQSFLIGGIAIHYYGLIIGLAVACSWWLAIKTFRSFNLNPSQLENIFLVTLLSGFIGARLYHVISSLEYYSNNLGQIFAVWNGGLSIFGAIIGGLLGLYFYNRIYIKTNFLELLDWLAPSVMLGQVIGRFGNLFNYEAFGLPTNLPWKMFVPEAFRLDPYLAQQFFHPLFLYESIAGLLILWILLRYNDFRSIFSKFVTLPQVFGSKFWLWITLYGVVRTATELLRIDSNYIFGIKQNLIIGLVMVIIGAMSYLKPLFSEHESNSTQNN